MTLYLASAFVVFLASCLHAATGFGFSILAMPLLLLLHAPLMALSINLVLAVALSLAMIPQVRRDVDVLLLRRLVVWGALGVPAGLLLLGYVPSSQLKLLIALLTLAFVVGLLLRLRFQRSNAGDSLCGLLAGAFTSAVGMGGVPLLLYFAGANLPKATVRGTVLAFFVFAYGLALAVQLWNTSDRAQVLWFSLGLLPTAFLGVLCGNWLFPRISPGVFRWFTYFVLAGNSSFLLWTFFSAP